MVLSAFADGTWVLYEGGTMAAHGKVTEEDVDRLSLPAYKGTPWTTADAIERLCSFVQSSLAGGYDGHGWEELQIAATIVRRALAAQGLCGTEQETC